MFKKQKENQFLDFLSGREENETKNYLSDMNKLKLKLMMMYNDNIIHGDNDYDNDNDSDGDGDSDSDSDSDDDGNEEDEDSNYNNYNIGYNLKAYKGNHHSDESGNHASKCYKNQPTIKSKIDNVNKSLKESNRINKKTKDFHKSHRAHSQTLFPSNSKNEFPRVKEKMTDNNARFLQFKEPNGNFCCEVCDWTSLSSESFLEHSNSFSHAHNLKNRFTENEEYRKREIQSIKSNKSTSPSVNKFRKEKRCTSVDNLKSLTAKFPGTKLEVEKKSNFENMKDEKEFSPNQKMVPNKQKIKCNKKLQLNTATELNSNNKNQNRYPSPVRRKQKDNSDIKSKKVLDEKNSAPAIEMDCNLSVSFIKLECKLCQKNIPSAKSYESLINNMLTHIQSKKHINQLCQIQIPYSIVESSQKTSTKEISNK